MNRTTRSLLLAGGALVTIWLMVWAGFAIAQNSRMTAEKVRQYVASVDLAKLTGAERAAALRRLEEKINALSLEERRKWRMEGAWRQWFENMTEGERGDFIEATMPSGFKQWLNAFEDLPELKRKKFVGDLMTQLKKEHQPPRDREPGQDDKMFGTNSPPLVSPELVNRATTIGLKTFFAESSPETKAELAPFLEEMQHQMESGKGFR